MPKTSSYGEMFNFVLLFELNANGNVLTICDHVSVCNPFDRGAYGVRGLTCTLYTRQMCVNLPLIFSFPLSVAKMSVISNLTIQWSNSVFNAFVASSLERREEQRSV